MLKNPTSEFGPKRINLNGIFRGVVEDVNDPDKSGRVKVRIYGLHSSKKEKTDVDGIPIDELPWVDPAIGIAEGGISGFGGFAVPNLGSHVLVFFEGGNIQKPIYFASLPGIPKEKPDKKEGLSDPTGTYPTDHRLSQPDHHRLARGESSETVNTHKENNRLKDIAKVDGTWEEPESSYKAQYPHNNVFATKGGIVIETDNTPGNVRLHIYHPSNTFIEISHEGNVTIRNGKNRYDLTKIDKYAYTGGKEIISTVGDRMERISGNEESLNDKNIKRETKGDVDEKVGGHFTENIQGNKIIKAAKVYIN